MTYWNVKVHNMHHSPWGAFCPGVGMGGDTSTTWIRSECVVSVQRVLCAFLDRLCDKNPALLPGRPWAGFSTFSKHLSSAGCVPGMMWVWRLQPLLSRSSWFRGGFRLTDAVRRQCGKLRIRCIQVGIWDTRGHQHCLWGPRKTSWAKRHWS